MELLQLKYFCDAAVSENFSATASRHHVPPSDVSQTIRRLERELGCELFARGPNRITLNEQGKRFFLKAKEALACLEEGRIMVTDDADHPQGEVRILTNANRRLVTGAIEDCLAQYPNISFFLNHGSEQDHAAFDLIISDSLVSTDVYEQRLLVTENLVLAMASTHPLAKEEEISFERLSAERFICMTEGSSLHRVTVEACKRAGFIPQIAVETDDPYYIRKYVELGIGIALVPELSWKGMFRDNVLLRRPEGLVRKTYVFYNRDRYLSNAARLFLSILEKKAEEY